MKKFYSNFSYFLALICCIAFVQVGMSQTNVTVSSTAGTFPGEIGWQLVDVTAGTVVACRATGTGGAFNQSAVATNGNSFELRAWESFGDGWNGAILTLTNDDYGFNYYGPTDVGNTVSGNGTIGCGIDPAAGGIVLWSGIIDVILCEITCPADIVASTADDSCDGGFINVPLPTVNDDCSGSPVTQPYQGALTQLNYANNGLIATPFSVSGVPTTIPGGVATVDVEVYATGDFATTTSENPNILGEDGSVIGVYTSSVADCSPGSGTVVSITAAQYNAWAANGTVSFTLAADVDVNDICATQTVYAIIQVPVGVVNAINDYNGTGDASDTYPVGTTIVTFTTEDAATGVPISCSFSVTVSDMVDPVINCPANSTINLDAGECSAVYNFSVTATDNCPLVQEITGFGSYGNFEECGYSGAAALACGLGTIEAVQELNVSNLPAGTIITEACFIWDQTAWAATQGGINLYYGAPNLAAQDIAPPTFETATAIASTGVLPLANFGAPNSAICIPLPVPVTYDPALGSIYMGVVNAGAGGHPAHGYFAGNGASCNGVAPTGGLTFFASSDCVPNDVYMDAGGFALEVVYGFRALVSKEPQPDPDNLYASGDNLPIGIHCFTYSIEDVEGNFDECTWCVEVAEFPEALQSTTLACNDLVNVTVSPDCLASINADMILEGGLYGCYETYEVTILGIPAGAVSNNGGGVVLIDASQIPAFVANGMAGPFEVRVADPDNGGNYCWGNIMLEDKYAPIFDCDNDVTIACTTSTEPSNNGVTGTISGADNTVVAIDPGAGATYQSATLNVSGAPAGAVITDVNVGVDITHTWVSDLTITLVTPGGNVVLASGVCGTADNIDATFDDQGDPITCGVNPAVTGNVVPQEMLSTLNGGAANGDYYLIVTDVAAGDGGSINSFSVDIAWEIFVPTIPSIISADCSAETISYTDVEEDGDCISEFASIITRTWTAVDAKGNAAIPCVQTIYITRETLAGLTRPLNYDGLPGNNPVLDCDGAGVEYNLNAAGVPSPYPSANGQLFGTGAPGGAGECGTIVNYYTDVVIPICDQSCDYSDASYKVVRKWTVLDWCTGEILEFFQVIKVMDLVAPVINTVTITSGGQTYVVADGDEITISTEIWGCGAEYTIVGTDATDNCSETLFVSPQPGTPSATVYIADPANCASFEQTVEVADCCENASSITFTVNVEDQVPPVVVAETYRTVSLSTDGVAKVFAESFDDGSHDGCGPIGFAVKRMDNGGTCPGIDKYAPAGDDNKQFNEMVHFCCADAGQGPILVQFMVCDDGDCDGVVEFNGQDNCNIAMVQVEVQDKLAPVIICPPNTTVSCVDVAGIDWNNTDLINNLFGAPQAAGTCAIDVVYGPPAVNLDCPDENTGNLGVVIRSFTVTNAAGSSNCTQVITIVGSITNTLTCDRIAFDIEDPVFNGLSNTAKRRFWYDNPTQPDPFNGFISHWCAVNDNINNNSDDIDALEIDCSEGFAAPEVLVDIDGLCTEAGISLEIDTFNFAGGACKKYLLHYEVIDQCVFDENYVDPTTGEIDPYNSDNGYFEFFLEIDAFDNEGPELDCTLAEITAETCTGTANAITIGGTDNCTDPAYFGYQWRIDLGANNTIDYPASGWYFTPEATPGQAGLTEWPIGDHIIYWIVSDGCGNTSSCAQPVSILPNDKAPTPYCYDGLATAVMPANGQVTLWASDFDAGSFDNCPGELTFTMIPESDAANSNNPYADSEAGWTFDCSYIPNGVSAIFEVRVYVTDANGNWDYCTASLRIDDNFDVCPNSGTVTFEAEGNIKTESNEGIDNVEVTVDADYPEFPMVEVTDADGYYSFADANGNGLLYENVDYTITPALDKDYLNGVTTLDIVMIQKHILGLDNLDSPYKLIAADANSDCKVTGTDLVQLRKLILGLYTNDELPANTSWRFVDGEFVFTDETKPCDFAEQVDIINMTADQYNQFVGVKVGDVNNTSNPGLTSNNAETRNGGALNFVVAEQELTAGQTYEIEFLAKDFTSVFGYQYTIELANATFMKVEAGALNVTESNFGLVRASEGVITTSFDDVNGKTVADDAVLFTLTVQAVANTMMSDIVNITSRRTAAEAYLGTALEVYNAEIEFRTENGDVSAAAFALYQNEPNPFNGVTKIGFDLPESAQSTLTVYDVTGKVLYTLTDGFAKGYNVVTISKNELNATGVLVYKLESNDNVATRKMIIIE